MTTAPMQVFFRSFNRAVKESPTGEVPTDITVSRGWVEALMLNMLWISTEKIDFDTPDPQTIHVGPHVCQIVEDPGVWVICKSR